MTEKWLINNKTLLLKVLGVNNLKVKLLLNKVAAAVVVVVVVATTNLNSLPVGNSPSPPPANPTTSITTPAPLTGNSLLNTKP